MTAAPTFAPRLQELTPNRELATVSATSDLGGLRATDGRAFPLQHVKVRSTIAGPCARTVVEQKFANPFKDTLDVTWIFPLPGDGALVALELRAGDIVVRGECQTRDDALKTFETARNEGKRAALVETEQQGVHTLSLAGLPPGTDVSIHLTIVELLPIHDSRFRWQFPTTIAPRFTPGNEWGHSGFGVTPDTDAVPNASRLSPPIRLAGGTTLDLEVEIAGPLSSLESSLHAVKMSLDSAAVRVAPSTAATLDRDFILEFSTAESSVSVSRAYTDGAHTVVIVEPPTDTSTPQICRDAVFVLDISGSMEGAKITAAKAALSAALHGLSRNDRFKVLAFDDRVERFRADFVEYNEQNMRAADAWIAALNARGGTEMLPAIQESFAGDTQPNRLRTVLFVTDGQSTDEARLLPAVANRKGNAVLFTLGIDTAVNASLLKALARAGGGACELCTPGDDIDAVVARIESRFGSPVLSGLRVAGAARPEGHTVFSGRPAAMLIEGAPEHVVIDATAPTGEFHASVVPQHISFSLGALWARERVSWLEERLTLRPFEEEAIKPEIVRIALAHNIASKFTSFVCVDHSVQSHGARRHVVQPTELPAQWSESFMNPQAAAFGSGGAMPSPAPITFGGMIPSPPMMRPSPHPTHDFASLPPAPMRARSAKKAEIEQSPAEYVRPEYHEGAQDSCSEAPGSNTGSFSIRETFDQLIPSFFKDAFSGRTQESHEEESQHSSRVDRSAIAGELARSQNANGSFGDDIVRSTAALMALLLLGSTRKKGDRRRTVKKLAEWLGSQSRDRWAKLALEALEQSENGEDLVVRELCAAILASGSMAGREGEMLRQLLD